MKKMMIIAAMVSVMLIPAQMEANNKVNSKPKVELNNKNDKKFDNKKDEKKFKNDKKFYNKRDDKKFKDDKKKLKKQPKPQAIVKMPAPRPAPLPQAQVNVVYESNPINAVASVIGLAALAAIIAN